MATTAPRATRTGQPTSEGPKIVGPSSSVVGDSELRVGGHSGLVMDCCPSAIFYCQIGCQQVPLDLLIKMVPSVLYESARIVNTHFHAKKKTLPMDLLRAK